MAQSQDNKLNIIQHLIDERKLKKFLSTFPTCYCELIYLKSSKLGIHTVTGRFFRQKDTSYENAFDVPVFECRYNEKTKEVSLCRAMIAVPREFKDTMNNLFVKVNKLESELNPSLSNSEKDKKIIIDEIVNEIGMLVTESAAIVVATNNHTKPFCYDLLTMYRIDKDETNRYLATIKEGSFDDDWLALVYLLHICTFCLVSNIPIGNFYIRDMQQIRKLTKDVEGSMYKFLEVLSDI